MNIAKLDPQPVHKVPFQLREYHRLPKVCGCYVLTSADGDILYVGLTNSLFRRFQEHLESPQKTGVTSLGKVIWFHYLECEELQLEQLERTWLNEYQHKHGILPELNKHQSPIR